MTRKKAIEYIKVAFDEWHLEFNVGDDWSEEFKARDMAIRALRTLDKIDEYSARYIILNRELVPEEEVNEYSIGYQEAMMKIRKIIVEGEQDT